MKVSRKDEEPKFVPFTLTLIVESEAERAMLQTYFNPSASDIARRFKESFGTTYNKVTELEVRDAARDNGLALYRAVERMPT